MYSQYEVDDYCIKLLAITTVILTLTHSHSYFKPNDNRSTIAIRKKIYIVYSKHIRISCPQVDGIHMIELT